MSAMSASSGLMPLSLISEHKAAQGGPPPVQPLSFAAEKHPLVQAPAPPKPTPNGMETSPPLVPVLGPPQPEPQPSLPCGGISDVGEEERSGGGAVPEVEPVEPSPPAVAAVPEQQPPAAEPTEVPTVNSLSEQSSQSPSQPSPVPSPASAPQVQLPESAQLVQQSPPVSVSQQSEVVEKTKPQPEESSHNAKQSTNEESPLSTDQVEEEPDKASNAVSQPHVEESETALSEQTPTQQSPQKEESETKNEQPSNSQQSVSQSAQIAGRTSKRTKNTASNSEKKSTVVQPATPEPKEPESDDKRTKRKRLPTQVYQSPIPELNIIAKISKIDKTPATDDRLIVFYRNEFLAVRNTEGGFYVCQAMQNVYKSSSKIKIRWLSQVTNTDHYSPDFYDFTEFDCILTNLNLERVEKNKYKLPDVESQRTQSILKRAIDVEKGIAPPEESVTEEHPDGLDLSLYRNEDQLKKKSKSKTNKKKALSTEGVKKSRESVRRKPAPVSDLTKKSNSVTTQPKRVVRTGKVEKPVVQRIIAAKKMGRRKVLSNAVTNKTNSTKEAPKKKEATRTQAVKRKNNEPPASTVVPEKKAKTGASKTRSGVPVAGVPNAPQPRPRRTTARTK